MIDPLGNIGTASLAITVGNTKPVVTLNAPPNGGIFDWGDTIFYSTAVTDAEEGASESGGIDCREIIIRPFIGHNDHSHGLNQYPYTKRSVREPKSTQ